MGPVESGRLSEALQELEKSVYTGESTANGRIRLSSRPHKRCHPTHYHGRNFFHQGRFTEIRIEDS